MSLLQEIRAKCTPEEIAAGNHEVIAAKVSAGRTRIVSREIGDGAITLALGNPDGPLFLLRLEQLANTQVDATKPDATVAAVATARQVWRTLNRAALDVGHPMVRAGIDAFVTAGMLTAEQGEKIKALASIPDPVTDAEVREALQ